MTTFQPIIVVGAARSGTKLLRDLIAEHPSVDHVPYDVNYIWRMGNESLTHDEFSPELATPKVRKKIHKHISSFSTGQPLLIEKTVSNCLRIDFVNKVFPNAKYIHLVREGHDVIESAMRQWNAPTDWHYVLQKLKTFPIMDAFGYGVRYGTGTIKKFFQSRKNNPPIWGPQYKGIIEDARQHDLLQVCARQWVRSVSMATKALKALPDNQVVQIKYEDLVDSPQKNIQKITEFLGISNKEILSHSSRITKSNIGKGSSISESNWNDIETMIASELSQEAYHYFSHKDSLQKAA